MWFGMSAEREGERFDAGVEKFDRERSIDDRCRLSDQLIESLVDSSPITALVNVEAARSTRRLSIYGHAETDRAFWA
jgi:hypothetical protein